MHDKIVISPKGIRYQENWICWEEVYITMFFDVKLEGGLLDLHDADYLGCLFSILFSVLFFPIALLIPDNFIFYFAFSDRFLNKDETEQLKKKGRGFYLQLTAKRAVAILSRYTKKIERIGNPQARRWRLSSTKILDAVNNYEQNRQAKCEVADEVTSGGQENNPE